MSARVRSAGLLLFRTSNGPIEVLLGHMGGPYWSRKDARAWTIPKGEYDDEDAVTAARREFAEELGSEVPTGPWLPLGDIRQSGGKIVTAWAGEGDFDPADLVSNTFEIEWPPRSGTLRAFPELDRVQWMDVESERERIVAAQAAFIDRLVELLARPT